jgi:hypothetical protein
MRKKTMKMQKLKVLILFVFVTLFVGACTKHDTINVDRPYLDNITGTYFGEFTVNNGQQSIAGTAVVTRTDNDEIQIHCYGDILDTTLVMDAFDNGDSVMLCNNGDDFYNEYGHMGSGYHMMDMGMGESEWMYHLETDHHAGDEHFGGFDMNHHTFGYSFQMMEGDTISYTDFQGEKW